MVSGRFKCITCVGCFIFAILREPHLRSSALDLEVEDPLAESSYWVAESHLFVYSEEFRNTLNQTCFSLKSYRIKLFLNDHQTNGTIGNLCPSVSLGDGGEMREA